LLHIRSAPTLRLPRAASAPGFNITERLFKVALLNQECHGKTLAMSASATSALKKRRTLFTSHLKSYYYDE
jgi:hypothetical protein